MIVYIQTDDNYIYNTIIISYYNFAVGSTPQTSMDPSKYKMIRSKNFSIVSKKSQISSSSTISHQNWLTRLAIVSQQQQQAYQIHTSTTKSNSSNNGGSKSDINNSNTSSPYCVMFNQHQYLKRSFDYVGKLVGDGEGESIVKQIVQHLERQVNAVDNNLIIYNALDLNPIQQLIFPWKQFAKYRTQSQPQDRHQQSPQSAQSPKCAIKTLIQSCLSSKKHPDTLITLSIISIKSDGSLGDQLNYDWIQQSKYIEDLLKIKQKCKLKIKKYGQQIKIVDLSRQQIGAWQQAEQIIFHYSQIKEYLAHWKNQLNLDNIAKIGEIYQVSQVEVDQQQGYITKIHKRKLLLKINQFMSESSLVMAKLTQLLKQKIQKVPSNNTRDLPVTLFMKQFFNNNSSDKERNYNFSIFTQLGTNLSIKQEVICMNMDLQAPGEFIYLKNYCDKPEIIKQVKKLAQNFRPLTTKQRGSIRIQSGVGVTSLRPQSISIIKQNQAIAAKQFSFDTYSSNQKKRGYNNNSNTFQLNSAFAYEKRSSLQPYQEKRTS